MSYKKRVIDSVLELHRESFGATSIVGPKGCGKTTTAKQVAKTCIEFEDEDERENLLLIANTSPSLLLNNPKPILFDEWQDAPKIWGTVRKACDEHPEENGNYLLTGSSSKNVKVPHTGTLRISRIKMLPMSLFESGESNGQVSLSDLFNHPENFSGCHSLMTIKDVMFSICRGGWPKALLNRTPQSQLLVSKALFENTYTIDISNVDNITRNPEWTKRILQSYARNLCTLAATKTIMQDSVAATGMSEPSFYDYLNALKKLYIIQDIPAWDPSIRSKTSIRTGDKRDFCDPSIAAAAFGISPEYLEKDFKTLGFLFECLCIRDLRVYSYPMGGTVAYYHDRFGLEADAVVTLSDGRYALIEFKLGSNEIDKEAGHLCEIEELVKKYNSNNPNMEMRLPTLKIIITATEYGYRRDDGVLVIPIGCLKD